MPLIATPVDHQPRHWPKKVKQLGKSLGILLVLAVIFTGGVLVGNGRISLFGSHLASENPGLPTKLDYGSINAVYDGLRQNYDGKLDQKTLLDGLKTGLAKATGDPYTEYFNPEQAKEFSDELNGSFTGIGAELGHDKDMLVVVSPISGFPAARAGLKAHDAITEIDGKSTADLSISSAVNKIRGKAGTKVTLKVLRGGTKELTFTITREVITIPSVTTKMLAGDICYISISRFAEDTTQLVTDAAQKCKQASPKGVVVDVRGDPGGLLESAVNVASIWLNNKTVLQKKRGDIVVQTYTSSAKPILNGVPTVVLIDGGSASASEILAGALKDNGAATLLGTKSFGKGSVQELINLDDGSLLKITVARWYTPGGRNIDKQGIEPDKTVKFRDADTKTGHDPQLDAALVELKSN